MNKKISPTLIGGFVLGALALLVIAVIAFGSGRLFRKTKEFVVYFDRDVNGLNIGAPVKFKGVEVGSVKNILLQLDQSLEVPSIPVLFEIDLKKITSRGGTLTLLEDPAALKVAIDRGLRAQLRTESLVTGVLYIGIDLFPGTPVKFVQAAGSKYPEIPAVPTTLERVEVTAGEILAKLSEVDFKGMMDSVSRAVDGVGQLVNSPALKSALQRLDQMMPKIDQAIAEIRKTTGNLDGNITTLSANFQQTSDAAREAMQQASLTMKQTDAALKEAEAAMINIRGISDPDSITFYELGRSLREVSAAARSLRLLSDSVQRNPRSLIFGKPEMREGK
ncbi:MAG: MCE family protein [Deltaproteobacteria bacterium]|nr:MAG: MCE family protein [Deltaproteobacteria bacterium]